MFSKKSTLTLFTAVALLSATIAGAAVTNPLYPSYYLSKIEASTWVDTKAISGDAYRDARNPLYPGFGITGEDQTLTRAIEAIHVDSRNPLYPGYQR